MTECPLCLTSWCSANVGMEALLCVLWEANRKHGGSRSNGSSFWQWLWGTLRTGIYQLALRFHIYSSFTWRVLTLSRGWSCALGVPWAGCSPVTKFLITCGQAWMSLLGNLLKGMSHGHRCDFCVDGGPRIRRCPSLWRMGPESLKVLRCQT